MRGKNIFKIIIFVIGFILLDHCLVPIFLVPYPFDEQAILDEKKEQYNTIFIGASKVLCGFNPEIVEKYFPESGKVYNAGTASQRINATFYYLADLIKKNDVHTVLLGLTYRAYYAGYSLNDMPNNYTVYDRLTDFKIKFEYKKNVFDFKDRYLGELNTYRYGYCVNNKLEWIKRQVYYHLSPPQLGEEVNGMSYGVNGWCFMSGAVENGNQGICSAEPWDAEQISEVSILYLNKIVDLCKKNNIELILVVPPSTNGYIYAVDEQTGSYDDINMFFKQFAESKELQYYNFNLGKFKLNEMTDDCYANARHLNSKGAYIFSKEVAEILHEVSIGKDATDYFFESFEDMRKAVQFVVCVGMECNKQGDYCKLEAYTLQEQDFCTEYQFWGKNSSGVWSLLKDYSLDNICLVVEEYVSYRVNARKVNSPAQYEAYLIVEE